MALTVSAHAHGIAAREALDEALERAKTPGGAPDPLAPVTIVAPSASAGYHIRRALGRRTGDGGNRGGIVNVQVKPMQALLELIGSATLAAQGRRPLPDSYRSEAIRAVAEAGNPVFGDVPVEGAVLRSLSQRFDEFDQCDQSQLDAIASGNEFAAWLVDRYRAYLERTAQFYSRRDLANSAAEALREPLPVLRDIGSVIVYLPSELSPSQRDVLHALSRFTDVEVLLGLTGDAESVDHHVIASWSAESDIDPPGPDSTATLPTADRIIQAPDAEEEVRAAIRDIVQSLLAEEPLPLDQQAILYRHADPYARICAEQLDAAGLVWNGHLTQTLGQSIAGRVLAGLADLFAAANPIWTTHIASWIGAAPVRDAQRELAPTARWNQLATRAHLIRGPDDWLERLDRYRGTCRDDLEQLARDADNDRPGRRRWIEAEIAQVDALTEFVRQLVNEIHRARGEERWSRFAQLARELLARLLGDRSVFAAQITGDDDRELARWDDVESLLTELAALDDLEPATPERFAAAVRRGLERTVGHQGRIGDGVYVGSIASTAGMHWQSVHIVGVAERALPQVRPDDPLLNDRLRASANLSLSIDHLRAERRDYLVALHAGRRRTLSYPRVDMRSQRAQLPSRWLLESATALNQGERVYASSIDDVAPHIVNVMPSFEHGLRTTAMPSDIHEYDLQSLRLSRQPARHPLTRRFPALARGFARDVERRQSLTRWDGLVAGGASEALTRPHSASALADWAICPYRYFLSRILQIEERDTLRDEYQMSALDRGALIHGILDQFFRDSTSPPGADTPWSNRDHQRLLDIAERHFERVEQRGLSGRAILWRGDRRQILDDFERLLAEDAVKRTEFNSVQIESELVFGDLPDSRGDVELSLPDGTAMRLRGIIDRVDRVGDGLGPQRLFVIDYKTGQESPKGSDLNKDPVVGGTYLQLPVYAHAARQLYGLRADAPLRSAYWFITERGEFAFNEVVWDEPAQARFAATLQTIVDGIRDGRFPANPGDDDSRSSNGGAHCRTCSFDAVCDVSRRRRWEQIQDDPQIASYVQMTLAPEQDASAS